MISPESTATAREREAPRVVNSDERRPAAPPGEAPRVRRTAVYPEHWLIAGVLLMAIIMGAKAWLELLG